MSDMKAAIMDAAERRMQTGGFGGFSFREIAVDVGIKSSSVHHHFPTKEELAAAVIRRWAEHTSESIDQEFEKDPDPYVSGQRRSVEQLSRTFICVLARCSALPPTTCRSKSRWK